MSHNQGAGMPILARYENDGGKATRNVNKFSALERERGGLLHLGLKMAHSFYCLNHMLSPPTGPGIG